MGPCGAHVQGGGFNQPPLPEENTATAHMPTGTAPLHHHK